MLAADDYSTSVLHLVEDAIIIYTYVQYIVVDNAATGRVVSSEISGNLF